RRAGLPIQGQLSEADRHQETHPRPQFSVECVRYRDPGAGLRRLCPPTLWCERLHPLPQFSDRHRGNLGDGTTGHLHPVCLLAKLGSTTHRAGESTLILPQENADVLLVTLALQTFQERDDPFEGPLTM